MLEEELLGKTAFSIEGEKLGEIIAIEGKENNPVQIARKHAVIYHYSLFGKDARIPLSLELIKKKNSQGVWFDITKDEFYLRVVDYLLQKKTHKKSEKEKYARRVMKGQDRGYYYKNSKGWD